MTAIVFERILVAVDDGEPARAAVNLAMRVAGLCGGEVSLVHVLEPPPSLPHPDMIERVESRLVAEQQEWSRRLQTLVGAAPESRVSFDVVRGRPASALLDAVREREADLVVIGTHGMRGIRSILGSVSSQVLEHAPCPVLVVRSEFPLGGRLSVIAAVDGSEPSLQGLDVAQRLAGNLGATLRLVHVVDPYVPAVHPDIPGIVKGLHDHGRKVLRDARTRVRAPLDQVVDDLREGSPRRELVAACAEHGPAITVIASRGLGGFSGLLLGSTTRHVVTHADCPVLVTRGGSRR